MKIDGKAMAEAILTRLADEVKQLGITPTLAVILVGNNAASLAYIRQKQKAIERIGGKFIFEHLPELTLSKELSARIEMYNNDPAVEGLIVQRPLPAALTGAGDAVIPKKDVDGFVKNSPYEIPIVMAIFTILTNINIQYQNKNIVIIGRGETAGKPIADAFMKKQCATSIIHSTTPNPKEIMKSADILISCVGKEQVITGDAVKPGAVLISVGLWNGPDNKLHGDYEEADIADAAGYYTPTPGGVGPLNVACLMQNVIKTCRMKVHKGEL
jgi:methylenetetrahydrofolate dehydrogenase (NADP+)/methenyltetrahydrofolate cyclohydrolase